MNEENKENIKLVQDEIHYVSDIIDEYKNFIEELSEFYDIHGDDVIEDLNFSKEKIQGALIRFIRRMPK